VIVELTTGLHEPSADELGGKGWGLARLIVLGLPVPPTLVIPVSDHGRVHDPHALIAAIGEPLVVRSSAVGEDAPDRSAAGQYESVTGARVADLERHVAHVYGSASSDRVMAYRGEVAPMAVVIQPEVRASRAGVAFSRDPITGADEVAMECVFGPGEAMVSGTLAPDRYAVRTDGHVRARVAARGGPLATLRTLRDDEARRVADLTRLAERGFGHPVDVEFCFDGADLWLVQCRGITALGGPR
jgi:phosphoenolpyruvate synthase/pyruvate phosphate dikinase